MTDTDHPLVDLPKNGKVPAEEPEPSEALPKYIREGLPKQSNANLRDIAAYCEEMLRHRNRPVEEDIPDDAEVIEGEEQGGGKGTVVKEKVKCGDESCHCMNDGEKHGPYKYRYYRDENGNMKSEYADNE